MTQKKQQHRVNLSLLLFIGLLALALFGLDYCPKKRSEGNDNSNIALPEFSAPVVDLAKLFQDHEKKQIELELERLEKVTAGQMALLTLPSLQGWPIEEYGLKLAEKWRPGSKEQDNGAILIICIKERELRLEIGYGWEGYINDARAGDIIRGMREYLQSERYTEACIYAIHQVQAFVSGQTPPSLPETEQSVQYQKEPERKESDLPIVFIFFGILTVILLLALLDKGGGAGFGSGGGGGRFSGGGMRSFGGGSSGRFGGGGGGRFGGGGASGKW
ncbi:MAG: methanol dehydrogenase [Oligosphaeraceae bacterium]|nr:methanol dehydrogenase [Oligosphaeraceae bacterium]